MFSDAVIAFGLYFVTATVAMVLFAAIYVRLTAHDEIALIRDGNMAAAVAFSGSMAGFAIPLARTITQSASIPEMLAWAGVALVVQLLAYLLVRWLVPELSPRIARGDHAAAILLAAVSVIAGMLNSAALSMP